MPDVILCNLSDANGIIEEEKINWIYKILLSMGVSEETLAKAETNIDQFKYEMYDLGIEVERKSDGTVDIYKMKWHQGKNEESSGWLPPTEAQLVAQWKVPKRVQKIEGRNVHYEIHLNEWSIISTRH